MTGDVERQSARTKPVLDYPSLAAFIASDRDRSTAIYRRFDRLAARNLLYLQSELVELEAEQDAFDAEDIYGPMETKESARNWAIFAKRATEPGNEKEKKRMELAMKIRKKIKEYRALNATFLSDLALKLILAVHRGSGNSRARAYLR
jgi:hypothetical protein